MGKKHTPRKSTTDWVVIAWVDIVLIADPTEVELFDGVNTRAKLVAVPEARAVVWSRKGATDLPAATKHADTIEAQDVCVYVLPSTEQNPLEVARARILRERKK